LKEEGRACPVGKQPCFPQKVWFSGNSFLQKRYSISNI
jgi:hypothetical protein